MLDILAITGPIYVAIALGYLTTRTGLFARSDMQVLGRFVINLALPALLFNALAQRPIAEILNAGYLLVYALGSLLTLSLGLLWARRGAKQDRTSSAYYAMGMSCSNSGFVGYPIALLTLGPVAGVLLGLNMIVENLLLIPLLLALAESGENRDSRWQQVLGQSLRNLLRNPMVLGLLAGFAVSLLGWKLPSPVARTVTLFSQASGALSLFEALGLAPMDPQLRIGLVLTAACPMLGIYPILAQRHGRDGLAAAALLGTTTASFVTISAVLWAFKQFPAWGG